MKKWKSSLSARKKATVIRNRFVACLKSGFDPSLQLGIRMNYRVWQIKSDGCDWPKSTSRGPPKLKSLSTFIIGSLRRPDRSSSSNDERPNYRVILFNFLFEITLRPLASQLIYKLTTDSQRKRRRRKICDDNDNLVLTLMDLVILVKTRAST